MPVTVGGLEEAALVFGTSLVYTVLNWRVLDMASAGAPGTVTVEDRRPYIKIETLRGRTQQKFTVLCVIFVVNRQWTVVQFPHWATRFRKGCVTINVDQNPGRSNTSADEWSVKLVADFLAQDRRATCEEILQATRISPTSEFCILTNCLQKRKTCAWWVPHRLTAEQKQERLEIATLLKQRFNVEGQAFLYRIVTIDETWVRLWTGVEISVKRVEKSSLPATQKISRSAVKGQANDDLYLWSLRNHHDRVPCGRSVTAAYYCDWMQKLHRKIHKNWPDLLGDGPHHCTPAHGEGCDRFAK